MIDLPQGQMQTVLEILARCAPGCEARVFGSRYSGQAKPYSDLDLALVGAGEIDWRQMARIREAFEASDLPFRVDVLDWNTISPEFREVIEAQGFEVIGRKVEQQG